ncbi:hypothetical protein CEXT_194561 [Caerostris extrusa]|uniref:Uncharacterized protein n=1 Tax=Caerostris extrusa TaxID=172846 RepID=A0AAV4MMC3_CAEEX|nr:hypothetical protein CEXT_194561 [Caerostris extrusa]
MAEDLVTPWDCSAIEEEEGVKWNSRNCGNESFGRRLNPTPLWNAWREKWPIHRKTELILRIEDGIN